jgi:hypothetical protein
MHNTTLYGHNSTLLSKIESLKARTELLTGLSKVVITKDASNIKPQQWSAINAQLTTIANKILNQLNQYTDSLLPEASSGNNKYKLINALGEIELELNEAYRFYDTYMDILTQRLSPVLGPLLRGCDEIAADGLKHSYLTEVTRDPIVYCDRGFGASILREGVSITKAINPVAFIAIPYSRLAEKYNLISIYHEVGHQALSKLDLVETFQQVFALCTKNAGANQLLQNMFANWSKEVVPDFWAFGHTGMAQTSSMRDVLLVPQSMAFNVSPYQQHPPCYLRFLISVEWCRFLWGRGDWDEWSEEWEAFYPVDKLDELTKELVLKAKKMLPVIARATITTSFKTLNNKTLRHLFDMNRISPANLDSCVHSNDHHQMYRTQPLGVQLAAFRLMRDKLNIPIGELNTIIHSWLTNLNTNNTINN